MTELEQKVKDLEAKVVEYEKTLLKVLRMFAETKQHYGAIQNLQSHLWLMENNKPTVHVLTKDECRHRVIGALTALDTLYNKIYLE